jgi:hypothetical protein
MALTRVTVPDSEDVFGKQRVVSQDITLDTSYPTGGYSIAPASLGWSEIKGVTIIGGNATAGGYKAHWDTTNKKLMVFTAGGFTPEGEFTGTAAAQVFTGEALAAHSHTIPVTAGTAGDAVTNNAGVLESTGGQDLTSNTTSGGTPAGTNSTSAVTGTFTGTAVSAAVLSEVGAATNLSTVQFRVEFRGI